MFGMDYENYNQDFKIIQFKVCLRGCEDNYRVFNLPSHYLINSIPYSVLALYMNYEGLNFVFEINDKVIISYDLEEDCFAQFVDDEISTLNLKTSDKLTIRYADNVYFDVTILNIFDKSEVIKFGVIERKGIDLIYSNMDLENLDNLDALSKGITDPEELEELKEMFEYKDAEISQIEFDIRLANIINIYDCF